VGKRWRAACRRTTIRLLPVAGGRGDAAQAAPRVAVPPPQSIPRLGEQRGEHDPADSRQGSRDRRVGLRRGLPRCLGLRADEAPGRVIEPSPHLRDPPIDEGQPPDDGLGVHDGGLDRAGRQLDRRRPRAVAAAVELPARPAAGRVRRGTGSAAPLSMD
jgi:hypothetical protein